MRNILHLVFADVHAQPLVEIAEHVSYGHHNTRFTINLLLSQVRPDRLLNARYDRSLILLSQDLLLGKLRTELGHHGIHEYHQLVFRFLLRLAYLLIRGFHVRALFERGLTGDLLEVCIFRVLIRRLFNQIVFS